MPVHPHFSAPQRAEELYRLAGEPKGIELLITIPSMADPVVGTLLAYRPRKLLLLRTRGLSPGPEGEVSAWLASPPADFTPPHVEALPADPDEPGLELDEILPSLEQHVRIPPSRVAYLVTGGTKPHTALLTRHAQAVGSSVVYFEADCDAANRPIPGTGRTTLIPAPEAVLRREALARARGLLRDRAFDAARETLRSLQEHVPADPHGLVQLTQRWIAACRLRDGMLFSEAVREARQVVHTCRGLGQPTNQSPEHRALAQAANELLSLCKEIGHAMAAQGEWAERPRLPLLAELLVRGVQERRAGRRNHCALLYYRLIEACLSERLRVAYGIDPGQACPRQEDRWPSRLPPDGKPPADAADFVARFATLARKLRLEYLTLDRPLGLLDSLVCLQALGDPALPTDGENLIHQVQEVAPQRNRSIFAHGYAAVTDAGLDGLEHILGVVRHESGSVALAKVPALLNLVVPDGPSRGELQLRLRRQSGPLLADDGTLPQAGPAPRGNAAMELEQASFLNLSNHPVATWTEEQRAAARALGLGDPIDLPGMPAVQAGADEAAVEAIARQLVERALGLDVLGAFVSTEYTLTYALVNQLRSVGVRCFVATTERQVLVGPAAPDGTVAKTSSFRFVRWREYPAP